MFGEARHPFFFLLARTHAPHKISGVVADIAKILHRESDILSRLDVMAAEITRDYRGKDFTVVAILNGSFVFLADLLRRIPLRLQVGSLRLASYQGTQSSGIIDFPQHRTADLSGRHVLILDDILDSGRTLHAVKERLGKESGAASLRTCVLLRKNVERVRPIEADYVGFDIPDVFVVGYGLDYNEHFRNLPFLGVLTDEAIKQAATENNPPNPFRIAARQSQ